MEAYSASTVLPYWSVELRNCWYCSPHCTHVSSFYTLLFCLYLEWPPSDPAESYCCSGGADFVALRLHLPHPQVLRFWSLLDLGCVVTTFLGFPALHHSQLCDALDVFVLRSFESLVPLAVGYLRGRFSAVSVEEKEEQELVRWKAGVSRLGVHSTCASRR